MNKKWQGVFPAVTTKFTDDDKLDFSAMERHFNFQLEAGVHGMVVTGSLGENGALSTAEKLDVLKIAVEISDGRVPVLAGVAENTTAEMCKMLEASRKRGADGFMLLPPMRYVSDRRETMQYLRTGAAATDAPIMIYNNPVAYGVDVTPEIFAELADEPKFVAIKESSDNVRRITNIYNTCGDRYQIFTGVDNIALESLLLGAVGWIAGLVDAFPRETVVLYDLAMAGRIEEARKLYRWFMPLLHLDVSTKLVQNIKLAETLVGVGNERVRLPKLPLSGDERERVVQIIQKALDQRLEISL